MNDRLVTVLACSGIVALAAILPVSAQFYEPPLASAFSALPGQEISDDVWTKSIEAIEVTLTRAGDPTAINRFTSAPCACQYPLLHQLRFGALAPGLYEIDLLTRDAKLTQELSVTTIGTISLIDDHKGVVMPVDLRTGRVRHDVMLSLRDPAGVLSIPIGADGLGHTSALVPGTKTVIARASDGSVVHQPVVVQRRSAQRSYGYLDRTTYRPGDPVYFTVISRFVSPDVQTIFLVNSSSVAVMAATEIYKSSCCIAYAFLIPSNTKPGYYWLPPAGHAYVEPRSDADDVDATPLHSHYNVGDTAVFAISARTESQLRYEIWLQNKTENDAGENTNVLLKSGSVVVDKAGIARISAVVKKQALKVEARLYEQNSASPIYVASADITSDFVQSDLSIPERRIVGQPLPMIARGRPLSAVYLKIYSPRDSQNPLFEDEKRTDANGYALFTWYPPADGLYRAEASQMSSEHPVSRSFAVGVSDRSTPQISNVNTVAMPQATTVAPGQSNAQLLFAPQGSDALVQWSSGSDFDVNVQRVGPVSRVVVPSSLTSDMVSAAIYGVANSEPWRLFTSFKTEPQPHRLYITVIPSQRGARIRVTDYRHAPLKARVIVTVRRASPAALLAPFDDESAYDALYPSDQVYGPYAQISWWLPGHASGTLATPTPAPTFGPPIPTLPPEAAPTIQPQSQTPYFNPFVETDTSGAAEITFPWSSSSAPGSFIISVLAITDDRQIGQAHSIIALTRLPGQL